MRIPLSWIKDYVDIDVDVHELSEMLTMSGTKVEYVTQVGNDLRSIIAAKVVNTKPHPTLSKLTVVELDCGTKGQKIVATAAKNVALGNMVPLVMPKGMISGGKEIGEAKFGDLVSEGMLCSTEELGLGTGADGILLLKEEFQPGDDLIQKLDLNDYVIEFEITPNRPDCLCVLGIAREIACLTNKKLKLPSLQHNHVQMKTSDHIGVEVKDNKLCSRYALRALTDVKITDSPMYMQVRLIRSGVRVLNNIVDITNYVMLECNQPLHAFDMDAIVGDKITVRPSLPLEHIVTLDGEDRELKEGTIVIADQKGPLAVAGVMGGERAQITGDTKSVLVESATFDAPSVWRTSRDLKLRSESSSRFEKGLDEETVPFAIARVAHLADMAKAGSVCEGNVEVYEKAKEKTIITTSITFIEKTLGVKVVEEVEKILSDLGFKVDLNEDLLEVEVPTYRDDVTTPIDIVEEIARIYGFNRIPSSMPKFGKLGAFGEREIFSAQVKKVLTSLGAYEIMTYTLISEDDIVKMGLNKDSELFDFIRLSNPMSNENEILRTTMMPSILKIVSQNLNRKNNSIKVFEIGKVYRPTLELKTNAVLKNNDLPAIEKTILSGAIAGDALENTWHGKSRALDFYDAKGMIETLLYELGFLDVSFSKSDFPYLHKGRTCQIFVNGVNLGVLGELAFDVSEAFEIKERTYYFELEYDILLDMAKGVKKVASLAKYPGMTRDIALVVPKDMEYINVLTKIKEYSPDILESVKLFDIYEGDPVPNGYKSVAYSLTFRSHERTLTDEEVIDASKTILERLKESLGAVLR